ncbi:carbohydrate kinase family protein, partial [Patescibacteria group bacterium]|nr:carbohydrate kinase family protein [Patescibacteria group bacterium]
LPFIFDPGQIIPALSKSEIMFCLKNAMMMIVNDYELSLIKDKTGLTLNEIKNKLKYLIVTLGPKGSLIYHTGKKYQIPVAKPKNTSDPTGAGDAYRAGIIKGLIEGFEIETMGRVAALASVYTVEKYGTQTHSYSATSFKKRYKENFSENLTCL